MSALINSFICQEVHSFEYERFVSFLFKQTRKTNLKLNITDHTSFQINQIINGIKLTAVHFQYLSIYSSLTV